MLNAHLKKIDPPTWLDFRTKLPTKLTKTVDPVLALGKSRVQIMVFMSDCHNSVPSGELT